MKYDDDVVQLLDAVGGKENIGAVSHCMTRMRFVLNDPKKADEKTIEKIMSVKGMFTQAGQFQVIIGNDVDVFYKAFTAHAGVEGVSKDAAKNAAKGNQNVLQKIMGALGEIFAPIIPAIICGGLILGFRNVIGEIKFFEDGTLALADISQFWAGTYSFLWLIGEAIFHMLPVGIVWSITKKMGTTQILGIVLGITLVSPQLLNGFAVASTAADEIPFWDFGFAQIQMIGYQGQVIAAIGAGFVLVYLEKFFKKICPEVISMIIVPFCALVPSVIIGHVIVGPIGWAVGNAIAGVVLAGLTSPVAWLFAGVFGLVYAPIVMTGLHHMTNAIDMQLIAVSKGTILWPMIALSNISQGSAVLAMNVLQRKNKKATSVNVPAWISCYLGVTEPALFGVNLKYGFPLICGMIGSSIAAMVSVGAGVRAISIGVGGLPGILSIYPEFWVAFLLAMAIAVAVPFTLTFIVGKIKLSPVELGLIDEEGELEEVIVEEISITETPLSAGPGELKAIVTGKVIPIEEVEDPTFSQKILGDGVGFEPDDDVVVSPCDAVVSVIMEDSKHACGLTLSNGMEILIHIGIDTVDMNGEGFENFIKVGDSVKTGDPLISFSRKKISKAGHLSTIILAVTEQGTAEDIEFYTGDVKAKETTVISYK